MSNTKALSEEFLCSFCGVPVGKLVPVDSGENYINANIERYDNWSPPKNGKLMCKMCNKEE